MNIKNKIKNDLWKINYIIPFEKKYLRNEKPKIELAKHLIARYKTLKPIKGNNNPRTIGKDINALLSNVDIEIGNDSRFVYFIDIHKTIAVKGNVISNFSIDYGKIVNSSFEKLMEIANGDDEYGKEIFEVYLGIKNIIERIICETKMSSLPKEKKDKIILYFGRMLSEKAEHFDEALQRILFFNQILWQTRHRLNGLGRLDLILDNLYNTDIKSNYTNINEVNEMIYDFLKQLSKYSEYKSDALQGDIGQIIILGGLNEKGCYFSNELTKIFLTQQAKLKKPDPKTILRVSSAMPEELLEIAVDALQASTGSPLFSNDDIVIPALISGGIEEDDAYHYCTSACWEPFIVGKSFDQNNVNVFDYSLAFDRLLSDKKIMQIKKFEELIELYIMLNNEEFNHFIQDLDAMKWAKDPLVSIFSEGCNEKRIDISEGGTKYYNYGITTVALPNVMDSLFYIKEYVFEKKQYNISQLIEQRNLNFKDESIYSSICAKEKSFGHDKKEYIELNNRITGELSKIAVKYKNKFGGNVKFGLSSPGYNMLSKTTKGDFSGRKKGMPYNTHISCTDAAYTEIVNYASGLNYDNLRYNGNVVDFFVSPNFIDDNKNKFIQFMRFAIKKGFYQMQMNILNSQSLINAKRHPEQFKGLIVRVWGFSAYFNDLPESYKNLLIDRALKAEAKC